MEYLLYKNSASKKRSFSQNEKIRIRVFRPQIWNLFLHHPNDKKDIRTGVFRFYISLLTLGKTEIYFAEDEKGNFLHSAYVIPRNIKYSFLKNDEWCIGPCNTPEAFRGRGIYPYVLGYILNQNHKKFCMLIRKENISSIRGAEKAGFKLVEDRVSGTKYLNRFILKK